MGKYKKMKELLELVFLLLRLTLVNTILKTPLW